MYNFSVFTSSVHPIKNKSCKRNNITPPFFFVMDMLSYAAATHKYNMGGGKCAKRYHAGTTELPVTLIAKSPKTTKKVVKDDK